MTQFFRLIFSVGTWLVLAAVILPDQPAFAREPKAIPFGHNLASTSDVFQAGDCTVGFQVIGCGLSNYFSIGTSPWILTDYNTLNLIGRYQFPRGDDGYQQALQFGYFKSYKVDADFSKYSYEMELSWLSYIFTIAPNDVYRVHFNSQLMHFTNDNFPFSLRRPWTDRGPLQGNLSALHEIRFLEKWYANIETGLLGFWQGLPQHHLGFSVQYRSQRWLVQWGFTQTGTFPAYWSPMRRFDFQQAFRQHRTTYGNLPSGTWARYDYSIHPEFALQYFF
jgi:hypothetical protein